MLLKRQAPGRDFHNKTVGVSDKGDLRVTRTWLLPATIVVRGVLHRAFHPIRSTGT